jgi:hypothetical protein
VLAIPNGSIIIYSMLHAFDPSHSPSEIYEIDERPDCATCCDTGFVYSDEGGRDFCDCNIGCAHEFNAGGIGDDYEEDVDDWFGYMEDFE